MHNIFIITPQSTTTDWEEGEEAIEVGGGGGGVGKCKLGTWRKEAIFSFKCELNVLTMMLSASCITAHVLHATCGIHREIEALPQ